MKVELVTLLSGKPILPGTLGEYYNVCGKTPCRCKDKENPQKHGPYYQLSYNLKGKNSSISIKKSDIEIIRKMTDNYREQISASHDLGLELLDLYKNEGCQKMLEKYNQLFSREISKRSGSTSATILLREAKLSKEKWKIKALARQSENTKLKAKIKDTNKSRKKWKSEAMQQKSQNKELQQEFELFKKNLKKVKNH